MSFSSINEQISYTAQAAISDIIHGGHKAHINFRGIMTGGHQSLVGTGASISLGNDYATSITPDTRNIISMSPEASVLIKKKAFSSLKASNDLRFMDKTEKMLLRATKALFAYKVQQIRAYESLTKFENFLTDNKMYSLNLLSSMLQQGSLIDIDKLGKTQDEYVTEKLEAWLSSEMEVWNEADDGTEFTFDVSSGTFVSKVNSDGITRLRHSVTNGEYIKSLPSSQAKRVLDNKRMEYRYEYEGVGGSGSAAVIAEASNNIWNSVDGKPPDVFNDASNFWNDLGDLFSYGASAEKYAAMNEDIISVLKRNAFAADNSLTTWIVDPTNPENYITGPGTGVIELATFTRFNTSINNQTSPSAASISLTYPYRIGTISEKDIELAIDEALNGTVGIISHLLNGDLSLRNGAPPIDGGEVASAVFETMGLGSFDDSLDMGYVRDRLRTFYLGKPIVNPPDPIHFYIRGNRSFTDYTEMKAIEVPPLRSSPDFDEGYYEIDNSILKAEYILYTGQAISIEDYKALRASQDSSFGMIHVFGGYVTRISESFSGGFWTLSVSCTDNMNWLNWSRFSIDPSLSDPKNILEDPLTPFDLTRNEQGQVTGSTRELLYENKKLLQTGLLSYDSGLFAGQNATEGNLLQGQYNGIGSSSGKRVLQHPNGFIYRWKSGVITATADFQSTDPLGERQDVLQYAQRYSPTVTNDALNNLDIPNILSILVVGQPYNIETFIEQSFAAHNISERSTSLGQTDPLTGVLDAVRKQNNYFGNFYPYRMLTMNKKTTEQMLNYAGTKQLANNNIKSLQARKVQIRSKINSLKKSSASLGASVGVPQSALIATLQSEIDTIDSAIAKEVSVGSVARNALTSEDEIGISINFSGLSSGLPTSADEDENQDINRAMMMVGAQRRIEDVRLNRDRNLFIVSDQYDTADIRPFILKLNANTQWRLFDGKYIDVLQKCRAATDLLSLEFFCNSQGHLEFRPPLWNRVPLSVLRAAVKQQNQSGAEIMPTFITNLFETRIESLYLKIHTLNVKIALAALMIGRYPDSTLIPNMSIGGAAALKFFGIELNKKADIIGSIGNLFSGQSSTPWQGGGLRLRQTEFETDNESNDSFLGKNLKVTASFQEKGDILQGNTDKILGDFDPIFQEQAGIVNDLQTTSSGTGNGPPAQFSADDLNFIRDSFRNQFGEDPAVGLGIDGEFTDDNLIWKLDDQELRDKATVGSDSILTKIKKAISSRDGFVTMLQANLSKQEELEEVAGIIRSGGEEDDDISVSEGPLKGGFTDFLESAANSLSTAKDILTGESAGGSVYDHLIQDDTRNLLGYGSGKRFVIKDEDIISANFHENPPEFTRVDIKGDAPFVADSLRSATEGLYYWAGATDFDLWRQYGYRQREIQAPFISDTEGQARPYAILELAMQKIGVNKADLTVVGNEFYQPGDTVYIPAKGLLYYIETISHTFSYGSSFTTNLGLVYGHPPGKYIPSPLDVIGQELVGNPATDQPLTYRVSREDDSYRVLNPDSTLVFPSGGATTAQLLSYSDNQVRFTNMMMDLMGSLTASKYVLIRGFVSESSSQEEVEDVVKKLAVVRSMLEYPTQAVQHDQVNEGDDLLQGIASAVTTVKSAFGGSSAGTTRSLMPMRLPNNMPVASVRPDKIIEQISYLKKDDETNPSGLISCLDRKLLAALSLDESLSISDDNSSGIFPKGGPRQGSWLDFRDEISGFQFGKSFKINVIEIGILTIPNSILNETR